MITISSVKKVCASLLQGGAKVHIATVSRRLTYENGLKSYKPA